MSKTGDKNNMVSEIQKKITELVNERKEAFNQKVITGHAIGGTFHFYINQKGKTYQRVNWSYRVNTENGPRLMKGTHEFQTF